MQLYTAPNSTINAYLSQNSGAPENTIENLSQALSLTLNHDTQPSAQVKSVVEGSTRTQHDFIISTIFSRNLAWLALDPKNRLTPEPLLTSLRNEQAVTVRVVNLFYSNPSVLPVTGFGYLIPQSVPFDQNPERALGVVFDSDAVSNQDTIQGTKLTVMMGGHYWDGWESYPSASDSIEMARSVLSRHLGITETPIASQSSLQRNCIPQYRVGHATRMHIAHEELQLHFKGQLKVAGNSYFGVGVNDCLRSALDITRNFATNRGALTGLEAYEKDEQWALVSVQQGRSDPKE